MRNFRARSRPTARWIALLLAAVAVVDPLRAAEPAPYVQPTPSETGATSRSEYGTPNTSPVSVPLAHIFFPPLPPPLDESISRHVEPRIGPPAPPAELSDFVGEIFYAPLSTLLLKKELSATKRQQLNAYRVARDDLRTELHQELAQTPSTDPEARRHALEALAQRQAARLASLEEAAESLRDDLVDGFYSWFGQRGWWLGEAGSSDSPNEVEAVLRAYAFFHDGLSPEIRGLLREIAIEFSVAKLDAANAQAAQPFFFFSPETARLRLPEDLPAPVAARVAEYETKKSALKVELYEVVRAQEKANIFQQNTLRKFGAAAIPRLVELEKLAEEIRRDFAALPHAPKSTPLSPLPAVLTERVAALRQSLRALQSRTVGQIAEIQRKIPRSIDQSTFDRPFAMLTYSFEANRLAFEVRPMRPRGKDSPMEPGVQRSVDQTRRAMSALADAYGRDLAENANSMIALRDEVARTFVRPDFPTADAALNATARYVDAQESGDGYRDYRTAVFEPGLSPAQRRLLFGHALEELRLPLPVGQLQPAARRP